MQGGTAPTSAHQGVFGATTRGTAIPGERMNDHSRMIARVQFLGAQRVEIGSDVVTPEAERLFAMIVRLSVPLGRITSRQTMMDTLWPGVDEANGRHNLRQTVYKAREIGLVVESGEDGLRLDPRHWSCDWDDPVGDVDGEWLPGYHPEFSPELVAWIAAQRVGVHALIRPRIIRALQSARSAGDLVIADRYALQLLGIDELNEEATLTRAELMAMQGAKVDALKLLDAYLLEIGRLGSGKDAALPAQLLRRRIAEKLPTLSYQSGTAHHGPLVGRQRETKRLLAGLFDTRAGRGSALLVQGGDGTGKSRLLHELKKSAVLQGMTVLELTCDSTPNPMPFATMRALVPRLLGLPGALGVSPEALGTVRAWLVSREYAPDDCPVLEIEDLLAAVSEETPLLLLVEHAELMDAETLGRLDRIYRQGVVRHHTLVLTSATIATPTRGPIELQWVERVALLPMSTTDVRAIVSAWAAAEQPRATQDQVACAAVFAEGVPMYGIEMLGLMLDAGSPDVIPWRVQVAVDRAIRELNAVQNRALTLCARLGLSASQDVLAPSLGIPSEALHEHINGLEQQGFLRFESGRIFTSALMSDAACKRVKPSEQRADSLRAATFVGNLIRDAATPELIYACVEF
ncbi:MAG: AAA family ATPase [Gemmatimonadaceae bacterium]|nr:AAA family ATPase [Gemmatimonadaceae bacterium]